MRFRWFCTFWLSITYPIARSAIPATVLSSSFMQAWQQVCRIFLISWQRWQMRGSNFKSPLCRWPSHASLRRIRKAEAVSGKVLLGSRFSIKFKQGLFTFAMINFHRGERMFCECWQGVFWACALAVVFLRFQSGKLVVLCKVFKVSSCQKPKSGTYLFIQDIVWLGITHRVCWWARFKYFSAQEGAFLLAIIKFDYGVCVCE